MEAGIGSLVLTIAVVLFLSVRYWDTKGAVDLDEAGSEDAFADAPARPH